MTHFRKSLPFLALLAVAVAAQPVLGSTASRSTASASTAPRKTTTIRVGYNPSLLTVPVYVADARGMFAKRGIKLQWTFIGNPTTALIAGDVDLGLMPFDNSINSAAQGKPLPNLMMLQQTGPGVFAIRKDLDSPAFHQPYPLNLRALPKGATVALPNRGSSAEFFMTAVLAGGGLREGRDFNFAALGGTGASMLAALQSKTADAAFLFPPFDALAVAQGIAVPIVSEMLGQGPSDLKRYGIGVAARPDWVKTNTVVAKTFVTAVTDAMKWMADPRNKARLIDLASTHSGVTDRAAIAADLPVIIKLDKPYIDCTKVAGIERFLVKYAGLSALPGCYDVVAKGIAPKPPKK